MKARFLITAWLALVTLPALAVLPSEVLSDPVLEGRARALSKEIRCQSKEIRCQVCQNQDIDDSNSPLAADLRRLVRERLVSGDSDPQILAYLTQRYGDYVLMRPPVRPSTWPLWFGPAILLLVAAVGVAIVARRRRGVPQPVAALGADEERRLSELMDGKP
jgi:cytochrome c-type biogenesis protein CcmH